MKSDVIDERWLWLTRLVCGCGDVVVRERGLKCEGGAGAYELASAPSACSESRTSCCLPSPTPQSTRALHLLNSSTLKVRPNPASGPLFCKTNQDAPACLEWCVILRMIVLPSAALIFSAASSLLDFVLSHTLISHQYFTHLPSNTYHTTSTHSSAMARTKQTARKSSSISPSSPMSYYRCFMSSSPVAFCGVAVLGSPLDATSHQVITTIPPQHHADI